MFLVACASHTSSSVTGARPVGACAIAADSLVPELDTVVVTLPEGTLAERFVARHTLADTMKLDCAGQVVATAAASGSWQVIGTIVPRAGPVVATMYLAPVALDARGPTIKLQLLRRGVDPRDALDFPRAGTLAPSDLMITRDTATIGLARSRPEFRVVPLAWDVTYLLLGRGHLSASDFPPGFYEAVTAAGIPGDVRKPEAWDSGSSDCGPSLVTMGQPGPPRIGYPSDDPIARALAERLVAISASNGWLMDLIPGATPSTRARTLPMTAEALDSAVVVGRPYAYLVPVSRAHKVTCLVKWNGPIIGLLDSRPHAIIRRGVPALEIDGEGLVRLHPRMPTRP